ncbi:hypothetical protein D3C80_2116530 [compost metagenome]
MLLLCGQGGFIAFQVMIEWTIRREQRFFKLGNGISNVVTAESFGINLTEISFQTGVALQLADDFLPGSGSHFDRVHRWAACLCL